METRNVYIEYTIKTKQLSVIKVPSNMSDTEALKIINEGNKDDQILVEPIESNFEKGSMAKFVHNKTDRELHYE